MPDIMVIQDNRKSSTLPRLCWRDKSGYWALVYADGDEVKERGMPGVKGHERIPLVSAQEFLQELESPAANVLPERSR